MDPTSTSQTRRSLLGLGTAAVAACFGTAAAAQDAPRPAPDEGIGSVWWVELVGSNDGTRFDYYKKTLAWSTRSATPEGDASAAQATAKYTLFLAGGTEVAGATVALKADPVKNRPMWIVYFRVDNVEKAIARALQSGGRLLQAPYDVPGTARMAVLSDLDGLVFGIAAPLQP